MRTRIPMRCLSCGNAVLTPIAHPEEHHAKALVSSCCDECSDCEGMEIFFATDDGVLSFGTFMDKVEGLL